MLNVNVAGPLFRMRGRQRELAGHVLRAARTISAALGRAGAARPATGPSS
jgi:hypothetical protein